MAYSGPWLLDHLAAHEPDPALQEHRDGLRVTRSQLLPPAAGGPLLWQTRAADGRAGFFLSGAVWNERLGRPDQARPWLALELLRRGEPQAARAMLAVPGTRSGLDLPPTVKPAEPATWEALPLGRQMRQSLFQVPSPVVR